MSPDKHGYPARMTMKTDPSCDHFTMIDWLESFVSTVRTMDRQTVVSLLILLVGLGFCMVCLHELYARYYAWRLPPGVCGLRCLLEMPTGNEDMWLKMLRFNQQYGVLSRDHEVRCH